jgi:repressor LexA
MTDAQRNVYEALERFMERETWPPTLRELAKEAGLASVSTVAAHLDRLARDGYIERRPGREAGIRPTIRRPTRQVFACSDPESAWIRTMREGV